MTLGRKLPIGFRVLSLISVVDGLIVGVRFMNMVLEEITAGKPTGTVACAVES